MKTCKVLIAEDEQEIREVMVKKIAEAGYQVVSAVDGDEAWVKILKDDPDIIILDIVMPKKNGFEILRDLKRREHPGKWQPVIIVSAKRELEDIRKGYTLEADHYITKPCEMSDIIKGIQMMESLIPIRKKEHPDKNKQP